MKSIGVFCGSSPGGHPAFAQAAHALGGLLAANKIRLIYGGGCVGLMGILANAVLEKGGKVIGVIPDSLLRKEVGHQGLTELKVVETMHERKKIMYDLSEAFIAMPGGLGTFDELFEVLTWSQLGLHQKPAGLLNIHGYFNPLLDMIDHAVQSQFIRTEHRELILVDENAEDLLDRLSQYRAPSLKKWIGKKDR